MFLCHKLGEGQSIQLTFLLQSQCPFQFSEGEEVAALWAPYSINLSTAWTSLWSHSPPESWVNFVLVYRKSVIRGLHLAKLQRSAVSAPVCVWQSLIKWRFTRRRREEQSLTLQLTPSVSVRSPLAGDLISPQGLVEPPPPAHILQRNTSCKEGYFRRQAWQWQAV